MIDPMNPKKTLKGAELQDGDIVCFQRAPERKAESAAAADKPLQQSYAHRDELLFQPGLTSHSTNKLSDRFEDAKEYYDFLEHKRVVKFLPYPARSDASDFDPFELVLNSKINYDTLSERVGAHLGVPATHIRFWTVNAATNNPKAPVRRGTNPSLRQILHPMGSSTFSSSQRNDAFYLEILEMSLAEFDTKKTIKVNWLSDGITTEVCLVDTVQSCVLLTVVRTNMTFLSPSRARWRT